VQVVPQQAILRRNPKVNTQKIMIERPGMGPYLGLCLPFFLILCLYLTIFFTKPHASVGFPITVCALVVIISAAWIFGHKVVVKEGELVYRDGFYRKIHIPTKSISSIETGHISLVRLGNVIKIPSLSVKCESHTFQINPVIFRSGLRQRLNDGLENPDNMLK